MAAIDLDLLLLTDAPVIPPPPDDISFTILSPSPGSITRTTPIIFTLDYNDLTTIDSCVIFVTFPETGGSQVIFVDSMFQPGFTGQSTRNTALGLWTFSVIPDGGWNGSPSLYAYATTAEGGST